VDQEGRAVAARSQGSANSSFSNFEGVREPPRCKRVLEIALRPLMRKTDLMRSERYWGKLGVLQECAYVSSVQLKGVEVGFDCHNGKCGLKIGLGKIA
jgi:hypothetical protein